MSKLFMTEKKITKLLEKSKASPRDHALIHMALATGFRVSDLVNLRVADAFCDHGIVGSIKIRMRKTGKMVERKLPDACRAALYAYLSRRSEACEFMFASESNNSRGCRGPMNRVSVHRIFKRYLGELYSQDELRGNACHVTRRSVAKIVSDKAGRLEPASRFLGHSNLSSTASYIDMDAYGRQADDIVGAMPWSQSIDRMES